MTTSYLCAGFVVERGEVTQCAPILRKKLDYWKRVAVWISEMGITDAEKEMIMEKRKKGVAFAK